VVAKKREWRVAASALAHRLHEVGLASDWCYRSLCIELAKQGWDKEPGEPIDKEGSQVLSKVLSALRAEGLRYSHIAHALHFVTDELNALMFGLAIVAIDGGKQGNRNKPLGQLRPVN
jgi:Zn-dependent peptidase ImmA (M78 family)